MAQCLCECGNTQTNGPYSVGRKANTQIYSKQQQIRKYKEIYYFSRTRMSRSLSPATRVLYVSSSSPSASTVGVAAHRPASCMHHKGAPDMPY